jgi:hypothetical protein
MTSIPSIAESVQEVLHKEAGLTPTGRRVDFDFWFRRGFAPWMLPRDLILV